MPRERLLEFRVQDGYGPLCAFLGVPVPTKLVGVGEKQVEEEEVFPRVNEGQTFGDRLVVKNRLAARRVWRKVGGYLAVVAVVGAGLWYLRRLRG